MRDLVPEFERLQQQGRPIGRAVVTSVWGSAPRAEGACLLATAAGTIAGSVSGGCVETATAEEIAAAIARGTPRLVTYGVSHEKAWEVGLACGGTIKVFVEPAIPPRVLAAARGSGGVVVATVVEGEGEVGRSVTITEDGTDDAAPPEQWLAVAVREQARTALAREASVTVEVPGPGGAMATVFLEVFPRQPKLVIFGGVHIAMALVPLARRLGYRTVVADGRESFVTRERFPEADELVVAWPEEAFRRIGLDRATYVCLLSHDPKFDEPALELALRSPAAYIGAIGSRKTQAARRERLTGLGFTPQDLSRLHGPIGLDLGGRAPAETALAILAEMTMTRYGSGGGRLSRE
jgi:xanthine dehydrogenase accessory factor